MGNNKNGRITVLLTGASGFIAGHLLLELLRHGYQVRGTLRSLAKESQLRQKVKSQGVNDDKLQLVAADLTNDDDWTAAAAGCDYIQHTASPLPWIMPEDEDELIIPARDGTLRVLKAAVATGVKRVVFTSSVAAISTGHPRAGRVFDESVWANLAGSTTAYNKSKAIAEKAAWDFVASQPQNKPLQLAAINPSLVLGPVLAGESSASNEVLLTVMKDAYPGWPRVGYSLVDVRDVADAHIRAMIHPEAAGKRFCCTNDFFWIRDIAMMVNELFANKGYPVNSRKLPGFILRIGALFDPRLKYAVGNLGKKTLYSHDLLSETLDWQPRPIKETLADTGESLIKFGLI